MCNVCNWLIIIFQEFPVILHSHYTLSILDIIGMKVIFDQDIPRLKYSKARVQNNAMTCMYHLLTHKYTVHRYIHVICMYHITL